MSKVRLDLEQPANADNVSGAPSDEGEDEGSVSNEGEDGHVHDGQKPLNFGD